MALTYLNMMNRYFYLLKCCFSNLHKDIVKDLVALDALDAAVFPFFVGLFISGFVFAFVVLVLVVAVVHVDVVVALVHAVQLDRLARPQQ